MELRHLLYFKTVAEELHFRKAATKLFISQPPLSRQIKELEEELGAVLFDRSNKKVKLTDAGLYFKKEIDKLFVNLSESKNTVHQIHNANSGELRIGFISSTFHNNLVDILKEMQTVYPHVKTKLYEIPSIKQIAALEAGKLDIGIIRAPVISEKLAVKSLFLDPFVLISKENLDDKTAEELKRHLTKQPFIFFNQDYAPHFHHKLVEICYRLGFSPEVIHEANNVHSILQLVDKGLGITILPASLAKQYGHLKLNFKALNLDHIFTEIVVVKQINRHSETVNWFIDKYLERYAHSQNEKI